MEIYILDEQGRQNGPFDIQKVRNLLASRMITLDTLAWRNGLPDWQPIRSVIVASLPQVELSPQATIKQVAARPRKAARHTVSPIQSSYLVPIVVIVCSVALIAAFIFTKRTEVFPTSAVNHTINGWLEVQKSGMTGESFWEAQPLVESLLSVTGWEILKTVVNNDFATVSVRVNSSNRAGIPIVKTWSIHLNKVAGQWKIAMMVDSHEH